MRRLVRANSESKRISSNRRTSSVNPNERIEKEQILMRGKVNIHFPSFSNIPYKNLTTDNTVNR
jgi:hypothetical protein